MFIVNAAVLTRDTTPNARYRSAGLVGPPQICGICINIQITNIK